MYNDTCQYLNKKLQNLISRFPEVFDASVFKEKNKIFGFFNDDFIKKRSATQLLQLITSIYIQKKELLRNISHLPKNQHIKIRVIPIKIQYPFVSKWGLGILVGISLRNQYEIFDQKQLLKAVQKILPELKIIKSSTYIFQDPNGTIKTLYIECEKPQNERVSLSELNSLKTSLKEEISLHIERVVPSVFMARNQEEILRNILSLSREINKANDLPQMMISFETQTIENFVFNILCVCSNNALANPLEILTNNNTPPFMWVLERKQLVKYVENHHPIFAYILQLFLSPIPSILRNDGSLNFLAARHQIVQFLQTHIGEFRDFNGGILLKQEETFLSIYQLFPNVDLEILENIFYAITPIEMQAILPLPTLQFLIQTILNILEKTTLSTTHYTLDHVQKEDFCFITIRLVYGDFYDTAKEHLISFDLPEAVVASLSIPHKTFHIITYILKNDDLLEQELFIQTLTKLLVLWNEKLEKEQILSIVLETPIVSLDPRIGGDLISSILLKLLFEGLMRINSQGTLEMALAQNIEISSDKKTYTFFLRPSVWSDGTPVTSYDFEYAWKKILSRDSTTSSSFFFDTIKNAIRAKKGQVSMSEVGIYALSNDILQIKLENPNPWFLEYLTIPLFFPICRHIDISEPSWPDEENNNYVCNGAFVLTKNNKTNFVFTKNQNYCDKDKIHLDKIVITSSPHSYNFFIQNKVHWLGGPMGPCNNNVNPGMEDEVITYSDRGIYWCTCNTKHLLLKNTKIRQALHLCIDKKKFLQNAPYFQKPAHSPIPLLHSQYNSTEDSYNPQKGKIFFKMGLQELGIPSSTIKDLFISYINGYAYGKNMAKFLQEQWQTHLDINITPQGLDYKTVFANLNSGNFHLTLSRWQPWVSDPMYTFKRFLYSKDPRNYPKWSHVQFKYLIKKAIQEEDEKKRKELLMESELIFIKEMPIIPLFHTNYQSIKKKSFIFHPNHMLLDFKWGRLI